MDFMFEEPKKYYEPAIDTSCSIKKLALVCTVAAPIQYAWALQLSLLTPYVQLLGVPHSWTSIVWLCGPISGMIIQPTIGHYSDRCTSRFGRRRPFLVVGSLLLCLAVLLIAFAADIGFALGDPLKNKTKVRAVTIFLIGFWILDISNNVLQGPCRALLADLAGDNEAKVTIANALFVFFMAVGNIIGYGFGSYRRLSDFVPFTKTEACDVYCANLKTCFIIAIIFVLIIVAMVVTLVEEEVLDPFTLPQLSPKGELAPKTVVHQLISSLRNLPRPMWHVFLVTALNWIGWFPFTMFSTDWMGKEVYGGDAYGNVREKALYHRGVWAGTLGLMLFVMAVGILSLLMGPLLRMIGSIKMLWGISSFMLAICMIMTAFVTKMAHSFRGSNLELVESPGPVSPPLHVKIFTFSLFALLGIPQAVTCSIPFALTILFTNQNRAGQGFSIGILNLAIVIPQVFVALVSGPLDALFGDSNIPAFFMGAIAAALSSVAALKLLEI